MPEQGYYADTIEEAVERIIPFLEDASNDAHKAIYFDGWDGLAASAVLRSIAKYPPPSLLKTFNKIIHVDCSRWKSRRALQRTIAQELKLPQRVMDVLDRQDEEDDFREIDEGSRAEMRSVGGEILQLLARHDSLVVFHNGSNGMVDLTDFGIPPPKFGDNKVLWTFRGRLRLNSEISKKVAISDFHVYVVWRRRREWNYLLQNEATEIVGYIDKLGDEALECCLYLLSLNYQGGKIMDYNWATHASSYWVCDGIIQGGQDDEAWDLAAALHQQIHMEDYLSNTLPSFGDKLETPPKRWVLTRRNFGVHPESTSFFLTAGTYYPPFGPLPNDMFHQSDKLRVLKLHRCTFSFSSPPFRRCQSLRFLGLDGCKDQAVEEVDKQDCPELEFFKSLWVLDICYTDWELDLSPEIMQKMVANIREVHIKNGRFWHMNIAWRQLQNLHKLRVIDPTCSWEMGVKDEFTSYNMFWNTNTNRFRINLFISASGQWFNKEKMSSESSGKISRPSSLIPKHSYNAYIGVTIDDITIDHDHNSVPQFQTLGYHVEIGEGISNNSMEIIQGIKAINFVMGKAESLHVHDNSSITTFTPENMIFKKGGEIPWSHLKQCHVARCPKMQTVFTTNYEWFGFQEIKTFWAADLLMAHCIWSKGRIDDAMDTWSFVKLRSIHLYSCPRLAFVLALSWNNPDSYFPFLEILHIVNCGDLVKVFPVEPKFLRRIATDHREGVLNFRNLKHIYLYELPKLQQICEAKIFAPKLETIKLRGCWSLRRLPTISRDNGRRPAVDCEKEWWEKLEWDGIEDGHDPSLFKSRHSSHYKKPIPRVSVLR